MSETKTVTLSDDSDVLWAEGSDRHVEVPLDDEGSACQCGCGCQERYWAIATSMCRWCQQGACDCSPSAIAADQEAEKNYRMSRCGQRTQWGAKQYCRIPGCDNCEGL